MEEKRLMKVPDPETERLCEKGGVPAMLIDLGDIIRVAAAEICDRLASIAVAYDKERATSQGDD